MNLKRADVDRKGPIPTGELLFRVTFRAWKKSATLAMRMPRTSNPLPVFEFFQARPAEKTVGTFILFFQILRHVSAPGAATMAYFRAMKPTGRHLNAASVSVEGFPTSIRLLERSPALNRGGCAQNCPLLEGSPFRRSKSTERHFTFY